VLRIPDVKREGLQKENMILRKRIIGGGRRLFTVQRPEGGADGADDVTREKTSGEKRSNRHMSATRRRDWTGRATPETIDKESWQEG